MTRERISGATVGQRALELSEAAFRLELSYKLGEDGQPEELPEGLLITLEDLYFDFLGGSLPDEGWDALYRANLRHVFLCTQRVAREMVKAEIGGSITTVTSIEGVRAAPGYASYAAAKAGVINYTKTAALELAPHGISVNARCLDAGTVVSSELSQFDGQNWEKNVEALRNSHSGPTR